MTIVLTEKPKTSISEIKKLIDAKTIDTWTYQDLKNSITRFDWIGGNNQNWSNLSKEVFFIAKVNTDFIKDPHIFFALHTIKGHKLTEADYAQMSSELLYMLMAHISELLDLCSCGPAENKQYHADIVEGL